MKTRAEEQITASMFWESIGYALGAAEESLCRRDGHGSLSDSVFRGSSDERAAPEPY
ncbi:hypothetical protein SUDANB56_06321 (plasmid) [Streptomyces sp. enrichment culture]